MAIPPSGPSSSFPSSLPPNPSLNPALSVQWLSQNYVTSPTQIASNAGFILDALGALRPLAYRCSTQASDSLNTAIQIMNNLVYAPHSLTTAQVQQLHTQLTLLQNAM